MVIIYNDSILSEIYKIEQIGMYGGDGFDYAKSPPCSTCYAINDFDSIGNEKGIFYYAIRDNSIKDINSILRESFSCSK